MGSIAELSIGDIGRALNRYRPVAATVLAILIALAVLPKPDRPPGLASTGLGGAGISTPAAASRASGGATSGAAPAASAAVDGSTAGTSFSPSVTSAASSFPSFSSGSAFSAGSSGDADSSAFPSGSSSDSDSSDFGPVTSGTSTVDTTNGPVADAPLQVVGSNWASRTGGTPLAKQGVPAGTLPVGNRGTDDKLSFVRLAGDGTALGFATDPAGSRETNGPAKIRACKVTEAWENGDGGMPIPDAPAYSPTACVQGSVSASGIWLFDLSSFADRTDDKGFALVPGDGDGLDWQVAFKR